MNAKKCLALLLSACMAASVLAGCKPGSGSSSSSGSDNDTTSGGIIWIDPDFGKDDDDDASHNQPKEYTVKVEGLGENGKIDSKNPMTVKRGEDVTFTVTANTGYYIQSIKIDGDELVLNAKDKVKSYKVTLQGVSANRTVTVTLAELTYTVTAKVEGEGGTVSPSQTEIQEGDEVNIVITRNNTYDVQSVQVNSQSVTPTADASDRFKSSYTFTVTGNADVVVTFKQSAVNGDPALVASADAKKEYNVGDSFDLTGLAVKTTYQNGDTVETALTADNAKVEPSELNGDVKEVKIIYDGKTYSFAITVKATESQYGSSKYLTETDFEKLSSALAGRAAELELKAGNDESIQKLIADPTTASANLKKAGYKVKPKPCSGDSISEVLTKIGEVVKPSFDNYTDLYMSVSDGEDGQIICIVYIIGKE